MSKNFLIPVGLAATALVSNNAVASQVQSNSDLKTKASVGDLAIVAKTTGTTVSLFEYDKGAEKHELLMKRSESGLIFADHRSHGSHGSHRSGR